MIIALHWKEWLDDLRIERFADVANAEAYIESLPTERTAFVIDSDQQGWGERLFVWQQQYTMQQLGQIASTIGHYQPPKFRSADVAARRIEDLILDEARNKQLTKYHPLPIIIRADNIEHEKVTDMPKSKLGEFKQVSATSGLGKVLKAHFEFDDLTVADAAAQTGLEPHEVVKHLKNARKSHGIDHHVDLDSKVVTIVLPDGVDQADVLKEPVERAEKEPRQPKEPKEPRQPKVGEFKPVRRDSSLGRLVTAAKPGDLVALVDMAAELNLNQDAIIADLKSLRRSHGFLFTLTDGMVELKVPEGKSPFILTHYDLYGVAPPSTKPRMARQPSGKRGEIDEKAAQGIMPDKPIITSESNMHRQKHFDALAKLAEEGKWDEVAAYHMNGIDSYSHMINRYRDRLLVAHKAQAIISEDSSKEMTEDEVEDETEEAAE